MKLSALWWTMMLCTVAATLHLVFSGQWVHGLAFYAAGFTLAVILATWRNK